MEIPDKYQKLLRSRGPTVFSVLAGDGSVQSSLVWNDLQEGLISINMLSTAPKLKRLVRNRKATILKVDPGNEDYYISIRCSLARIVPDGAIEHLDRLTQRHLGSDRWYGDVVPENDEAKNDEVLVYLKPEKIYCT